MVASLAACGGSGKIDSESASINESKVEEAKQAGADFENGKFYQRAIARGLQIRTVELGPGKVMLMEAAELARIGLELIAEDPRVLLCDNPKCGFCSRF